MGRQSTEFQRRICEFNVTVGMGETLWRKALSEMQTIQAKCRELHPGMEPGEQVTLEGRCLANHAAVVQHVGDERAGAGRCIALPTR